MVDGVAFCAGRQVGRCAQEAKSNGVWKGGGSIRTKGGVMVAAEVYCGINEKMIHFTD